MFLGLVSFTLSHFLVLDGCFGLADMDPERHSDFAGSGTGNSHGWIDDWGVEVKCLEETAYPKKSEVSSSTSRVPLRTLEYLSA